MGHKVLTTLQILLKSMYSKLRNKLRSKVLSKFLDALYSNEVTETNNLKWPQPHNCHKTLHNLPAPYSDLPNTPVIDTSCKREDIIFITGRFRSGSTLLWNIFRELPTYTAYYEPFNERRWFDKTHRGKHVDNTHLGVKDYWTEYENVGDLNCYNEDWIHTSLLMNEDTLNFDMKQFICQLIQSSPQRPVLQFNRIDFRLPWIKHNFPKAKIIHIFRHPRDQWCSFLGDLKSYPANADSNTQFPDRFYLQMWTRDLTRHFPFLAHKKCNHAYMQFYYLWKLSYIFGAEYADLSFAFEDLINSSEKTFKQIMQVNNDRQNHFSQVADIIKKPKMDKWKEYASATWFSNIEVHCEEIIEQFMSNHNAEQI